VADAVIEALIRVLIWREFGVLYHRPDVWTVLHH
jgi:hypothetical protein